MVKKIIIGIMISIFIILGYNPVMSYENKPMEESVQKAFKYSGAKINTININGWAIVQEKFIGIDLMKKWIEDIRKELNLENVKLTEKDYNTFREVKMEYSGDEKRVVVIFQSLHEDVPQTYLIVDEYLDDFRYINDKTDIERVFENYNKKPEISILCEGTFDGRKSYNELEAIKNKVINSIHGSVINEGYYDNFISTTAYSPEIKEYIAIGGEKININVALRYSSYDDKTHIYIGSPIITSEY